MEVGSCYDIPGETGCCVCFETRGIVDEVGNDHFQKLVGKSVHLAIHRDTCPTQNPECEYVIDSGPVPNGAGDEAGPYDALTTERGDQGDRGER